MNRYNKNANSKQILSNENLSLQTLNHKSTTGQQRRKAIDLSIQYNLNRRAEQITRANQKLLQRLLNISERKQTPLNSYKHHKGKQIARIFKLKSIQLQNKRIGTRLMNKQSQYDHLKIHKEMRSYQRLKKMMANNKKAANDRIVIPTSLKNPYQSNSNKNVRKIKTQPIQQFFNGQNAEISQQMVKSGKSIINKNVSNSQIQIQLSKTQNQQINSLIQDLQQKIQQKKQSYIDQLNQQPQQN